jgi:hypothetical protein
MSSGSDPIRAASCSIALAARSDFTARAFLSHLELDADGEAAECSPRSTHSAPSPSGWLVLCLLTKTPPVRPEDLTILEQFVQLKGVADGMHDGVLQH